MSFDSQFILHASEELIALTRGTWIERAPRAGPLMDDEGDSIVTEDDAAARVYYDAICDPIEDPDDHPFTEQDIVRQLGIPLRQYRSVEYHQSANVAVTKWEVVLRGPSLISDQLERLLDRNYLRLPRADWAEAFYAAHRLRMTLIAYTAILMPTSGVHDQAYLQVGNRLYQDLLDVDTVDALLATRACITLLETHELVEEFRPLQTYDFQRHDIPVQTAQGRGLAYSRGAFPDVGQVQTIATTVNGRWGIRLKPHRPMSLLLQNTLAQLYRWQQHARGMDLTAARRWSLVIQHLPH
jgi:hypothetical protein